MVLQYLFLCVFCWMLSEGIMLYFLVVRVFSNVAKRWYLLLLLGWGECIAIIQVTSIKLICYLKLNFNSCHMLLSSQMDMQSESVTYKKGTCP